MLHNIRSIFPFTLTLLLVVVMIVINASISTEVKAESLVSLDPQPALQSGLPDNHSRDDDDDDKDDGGEGDDGGEADHGGDSGEADKGGDSGEADKGGDSGEADKGGDSGEADKGGDSGEADKGGDSGEANDGGGGDSQDQNTPQPGPSKKEASDHQDRQSEPTDYIIVKMDGCELTCSAAFKGQTIELLAQVQMVHEGSGFIVEGVISNLKSSRFSVPFPGKWNVFLIAQPQLVSAQPINDPQVQAALAASFNGVPRPLGTVETNTSGPQVVKCPLVCGAALGLASDRGVVPISLPGNPQAGIPKSNCGVFEPSYREFRIEKLDSLGSGHYSDGFLSLDIVVTLSTSDGPSFDWSIASDSTVKTLPGMFVKGGNGGNWYDYSLFTDDGNVGAKYDGYMHSPVNPQNGKFYGLSHVSFCYHLTPAGGKGVGSIDSNTSGGGAGVGGTNTVATQVWLDTVVGGVTGNAKPALLPETGIVRIWDYSLITVSIIGGLSLVVIGLYCYGSRTRDFTIGKKRTNE